MDPKTITEEYAVAGQITVADVADIAARGFKAITVHRPDGEGDGQTPHADIEAAAKTHGIALRYLPVTPGQIGPADIDAFRDAFDALPKPILGYCGSGMRATQLWALSREESLSTEDILKTAQAGGYDLTALKDRLDGR